VNVKYCFCISITQEKNMSHRGRQSKPRLVRPPRSLADIDSKEEDVTSILMLETCALYICTGELYMVGYRENDLDDVTDMDGLLAKVEPVTFESISHPPRIIQSYILHVTTSPILLSHDIAIALTCEYSILFVAKGITLSEFHFSEIVESYVSEDECDKWATLPSVPITMEINESASLLTVITQGKVLIVTLNFDFIINNIDYFASDEASKALEMDMDENLHQEEGDGYGFESRDGEASQPENKNYHYRQQNQGQDQRVFDYGQCIRGEPLVIDVSEWQLLAADPTSLSELPSMANAPPMFTSHTEYSAIWAPSTVKSSKTTTNTPTGVASGEDNNDDGSSSLLLRCTVVCAGNGNWLEFLPLTRKDLLSPWVRRGSNKLGFNPQMDDIANKSQDQSQKDHPEFVEHEGNVTMKELLVLSTSVPSVSQVLNNIQRNNSNLNGNDSNIDIDIESIANTSMIESKVMALRYENEVVRSADHTGWITCLSTNSYQQEYSCTGDAIGYIVVWKAVSDKEMKQEQDIQDEKIRFWYKEYYNKKYKKEKINNKDESEVVNALLDEETESVVAPPPPAAAGGGTAGPIAEAVEENGDGNGEALNSQREQEQEDISHNDRFPLGPQNVLFSGYKKVFKIKFSYGIPITCCVSTNAYNINNNSNSNSNDDGGNVNIDKDTQSFWIGNHSGEITLITIIPQTQTYQTLCKISVLCSNSPPTTIYWKPSKKFVGYEVDGRLRFICKSSGQIIENQIQGIKLLFNTSSGPSFNPKHRSIVEACSILIEHELLITGGSGKIVNIWSLITGELKCSIDLPDFYVTCISSYDIGYVDGGIARILIGHHNGNIHNYILKSDEIFEEDKESISSSTIVSNGGQSGVQSIATNDTGVQQGQGQGKVVTNNIKGNIVATTAGAGAGGVDRSKRVGTTATQSVTAVDILDTLEGEDEGEGGVNGSLEGGSTSKIIHGSVASTKFLEPQSQHDSNILDARNSHQAMYGDPAGNENEVLNINGSYITIYSLHHETSYKHCPLPVCSIHFSALGLYYSFCYSLQLVIILDAGTCHIAIVQ
jgi:hypothetical protein